MRVHNFPNAIRLLGFSREESLGIKAAVARAPKDGPRYFCLHEDSLQEPDVLIANADNIEALAELAAANPGTFNPGVVIGTSEIALPYPRLTRPLAEEELFELLASLMATRDAARGDSKTRGLPAIPERRRRNRLDLDLTDPAVYISQRRPPPRGAVLIIDKGAAFRDHVAKLIGGRGVSVEWTDSPATAVRLCDETPISVVLINTSTPDIDPYGLSATIKSQRGAERTAIVLLVGTGYSYSQPRAGAAGVRGLLDKPIADRTLIAVLKKLLSLPA